MESGLQGDGPPERPFSQRQEAIGELTKKLSWSESDKGSKSGSLDKQRFVNPLVNAASGRSEEGEGKEKEEEMASTSEEGSRKDSVNSDSARTPLDDEGAEGFAMSQASGEEEVEAGHREDPPTARGAEARRAIINTDSIQAYDSGGDAALLERQSDRLRQLDLEVAATQQHVQTADRGRRAIINTDSIEVELGPDKFERYRATMSTARETVVAPVEFVEYSTSDEPSPPLRGSQFVENPLSRGEVELMEVSSSSSARAAGEEGAKNSFVGRDGAPMATLPNALMQERRQKGTLTNPIYTEDEEESVGVWRGVVKRLIALVSQVKLHEWAGAGSCSSSTCLCSPWRLGWTRETCGTAARERFRWSVCQNIFIHFMFHPFKARRSGPRTCRGAAPWAPLYRSRSRTPP